MCEQRTFEECRVEEKLCPDDTRRSSAVGFLPPKASHPVQKLPGTRPCRHRTTQSAGERRRYAQRAAGWRPKPRSWEVTPDLGPSDEWDGYCHVVVVKG